MSNYARKQIVRLLKEAMNSNKKPSAVVQYIVDLPTAQDHKNHSLGDVRIWNVRMKLFK